MSPNMNSSGRVLVCHDLEVVAMSFAALLRSTVSSLEIDAATTVGEIVMSLESGVDLVVLAAHSLVLFESAGNEAFQRGISVSRPKIVLLSRDINDQFLKEAQNQGIDAVIDARQSAEHVVGSVFAVLNSEERATGVHAFQHWKLGRHSADLIKVCRDDIDARIISLIIEGMGNEEIAAQTFIAVQTVRNRISRLLAAAGAKNRTQLAIMFSRDADSQREKNANY